MGSRDAYKEDGDLQILDRAQSVSSYWKVNPSQGLHIVVQHLSLENARKRQRVDSDDLQTTYLRSFGIIGQARHDFVSMFETRKVIRDGTLPEVTTPNEYKVLIIPGETLRRFGVSTTLLLYEYAIALRFAIFVAQGGSPPGPFAEKENDAFEDGDDPLLTHKTNGIQLCSRTLSDLPKEIVQIGYIGHRVSVTA